MILSILSVPRSNIDRNRQIHQVHGSEAGIIGKTEFFDHGMICSIPGLLSPEGICLSQRGKRTLAQELARAHWLNFNLEYENISLASDEYWDSVPKVKKMNSHGIPQSAS